MSKLSEAISFYHSLEGQGYAKYDTLLAQIKKEFGAKTAKAFAQEIDGDTFVRNYQFNLWWKAWAAAWEFQKKYPYHGPNIF